MSPFEQSSNQEISIVVDIDQNLESLYGLIDSGVKENKYQQSNTQSSPPVAKSLTLAQQDKKTLSKKRSAKNVSQNISSTIKTEITHILSCTRKRHEVKNIKSQLTQFLDEHKANNDQLVILFCYMFLLKKEISDEWLKEIDKRLSDYLDKKFNQWISSSSQEKSTIIRKIQINKTILNRYFQNREWLDFDWLRIVCCDLFQGRQKNSLQKPLAKLETIQNLLMLGEIQEQSDISIENFFELNSNY